MAHEQKPGVQADDPVREADDEEFARAMSGVVPLGPDPRERVRVPPPARNSRSSPPGHGSDDDASGSSLADANPLVPATRQSAGGLHQAHVRRSATPADPDGDAFARAMADVIPLDPDPRETVRVLPSGNTGRRSSSAPESDDDAFARAMADVLPLTQDPRGRVRSTPTIAVPHHPAPDPEIEGEAAFGFVRPGVDRRELRKLKRGAYPVDDRRDLHGMTGVEACVEVERFIESSRHKRHRCVCIVHGRGLRSKDQVAVLKTRVRQALRSNPAVLACTDAPSSDGGTGAVYALLRR